MRKKTPPKKWHVMDNELRLYLTLSGTFGSIALFASLGWVSTSHRLLNSLLGGAWWTGWISI